MKSLLTALQEGRLIELPDNNKNKALEYLATLIEAIPDIGFGGGITESVLAREQAHNTGIGKGWACPHARSPRDGELVCSVGWAPTGIDYGSPDGEPVHLLVMYFVPDAQKNAYLKEVSSLAKAIHTQPTLQDLKSSDRSFGSPASAPRCDQRRAGIDSARCQSSDDSARSQACGCSTARIRSAW